jgi:RHS repeat-associated protein
MTQTGLISTCVRMVALFSASLLLILTLHATTLGQGSTPERGFQSGGSYTLSEIETINTTNGNLSLQLPLGKLAPGRSSFSGQLNLHYHSKLYDSKLEWYQDWDHLVFGEPHTVIRNKLMTSDQGGWHYGTGYELQIIDRMSQYPLEVAPQYPAQETIYHYKVRVVFPDGSVHEFMPRVGSLIDQGYSDIRPDGYQTRFVGGMVQDVPYFTTNLTYFSIDGTYIRLEVQHDSDSNWWNNPWTLYFPDGTRVTNSGARITDRNGNYIEFSNVTYNGHPATQLMDQLGRKVIVEHGGVSNGDIVHVPGVGGADMAHQVHWKTIQVYKTYSTTMPEHFSQESQNGYPDMLGTQFVVSEIDMPAESGGLKYLFGYNAADFNNTCCTASYGWGELNSITTPTGAQAQYIYALDGQNGPGMGQMWREVLNNAVTQKTLTYLQQYDGSSTLITETWTYSPDVIGGNGGIINPDGGAVSQWNYGHRNYRTQNPDGTTIEKIWAANRPQNFNPTSAYDEYTGIDAYDPQGINAFVKTEFTSIKDAGGNFTKTAIKDYNYDKNGNVTRVAEYDWVDYASVPRGGLFSLPTGIPANAVLKRVTTNTMARWTPDASDSTSSVADSYFNSTAPNLRNAIASSEVSNGSTTLARTEFTYDNAGTTGNMTQQRSWDSTKGAYSNPLSGANSIFISSVYDSYGNTTLKTDARGYQTQFVYGTIGGFTDLYPTQIKTAYQTSVQRTETREYDFSTGLVTRTTDVDNNVSTSTTYDIFSRPTLVKAAEGKPEETRTKTIYSDVDRRVIVKSDFSALGDEKLVSIQHYDQLGRVRLSRQLEDASTESATDETTGIKVQTRYLYSGNFGYVLSSNPYRAATSAAAGGETTMGWTRSKSDNGGRLIEVQTFSGAGAPGPWGANTSSSGTVTTAYDGNFATVTDQAGKVRRSMTDGLGRLARVDEPDASGNLGTTSSPAQPTSYSYNAFNNLVTINQGVQTRSFVYNSLAQLTSVTNPESGTVTLQYDNNGNLSSKTDARNITITYAYDALDRNTSVNFSNTTIGNPDVPDITKFYDGATNGKGLFWYSYRAGNNSVGNDVEQTAIDSYDALGRPLIQRQLFKLNGTWSQAYQTSREYNRASRVITQTYPSGHTITNSFDAAGRSSTFTGNLGDGTSRTYASNLTYAPSGALSREQFGTTTPLYHKLFYNSRGQLFDTRLSSVNDTWDWNRGRLILYYSSNHAWGQSGTDNNGNVRFAENWIPPANATLDQADTLFEDAYAYDSLNRLTSVAGQRMSVATGWGAWQQQFRQQYSYDRYGNRSIDAAQTWGTGINNKQFTVDTATNRLGVPGGQSGAMTYDAAGNLTNDTYTGAGTREYDADNKMTRAWGGNNQWQEYSYDADGHRTRRKIDGQTTWQIYGLGGDLLAEYAANGSPAAPQKEYGYRNGQLLITAEGSVTNRTNVALSANGGSATASSYLGAPYNYYASYVNDGQRRAANENIWLDNTYQSFPDWVQIDFNGTKTINEIDVVTQQDSNNNPVEPTLDMTFASWGVTAFEVQYWNGASWATVPNGSVTGNNKVWRQFTFANITTSKIRVTVNAGVDNVYSRVVEVEAWTPASSPRTNYASSANGGSATASSYLGAPYNYYASYVNDGQRRAANENIWLDNTYQSFPDWVQIDFNGTKTINEIDVVTQQDNNNNPVEPTLDMTFASWGITAFEVQYWNGASWATVPNGSVTGNNKVWRQFTFADITTSKIRVTVNAGVDNVYSRVVEVEAWGGATGGSSAKINWLVPDHLGTPRMIVDQTGALANLKRHDYLPFGEELFAGRSTSIGYSSGDGVRQQFTGQERDVETGLDYFGARYASSTQGRFTSSDTFGGSRQSPQTLNLYSYVQNNPIRYTDPTGHFGIDNEIDPFTCMLCKDQDPPQTTTATKPTVEVPEGFELRSDGALQRKGGVDIIQETVVVDGSVKAKPKRSFFGRAFRFVGRTVSGGPIGGAIRIFVSLMQDPGIVEGGVTGGGNADLGPNDVGFAMDAQDTFLDHRFDPERLDHDEVFYRVYSDPARMKGPFLTADYFTSSEQAIKMLALRADFGNKATHIVSVLVPAGTVIARGIAGPQPPSDKYPGGASQVMIGNPADPRIKWINPHPIGP